MGPSHTTVSRCHLALALVFLFGCPSSATPNPPGDGGRLPDGGRIVVPLPPCGATDGLACTQDGGAEGVCCDSFCTDTQQDSNNCDGCGQGCPVAASCNQGTCFVGDVVATCADAGCAPQSFCAMSSFCVPSSCGPGTPGGACALSTGAQGICCDGGCFEAAAGCAGMVSVGPSDGGDGGGLADGGLDGGDAGVAGAGDAGDAGSDAGPACGATDGLACKIDGVAPGVCCEGSCVDTQSNAANCDGCGNNCPSAASCIEGTCLTDAGVAACDAGGCGTSLICVGGYLCLSASCGTGETGAACALGDGGLGACVSGACADRVCVSCLDAGVDAG